MNITKQAIVTEQAELDSFQAAEHLALFNADGTPFTGRNLVFEAIIDESTFSGLGMRAFAAEEPAPNTIVVVKFPLGCDGDIGAAFASGVSFNGAPHIDVYLGGSPVPQALTNVSPNGVIVYFFDGEILHQIGEYSSGYAAPPQF